MFKPERDEFDEVINNNLIVVMGFSDYKMTSKPLVIEDVNLKLEGLQVAIGTNRVDMADVIYELNEATGLSLKVTEEPEPPAVPSGLESTHTVDNAGNLVPIKPVHVEAPSNTNAPGGMPTGSSSKVSSSTTTTKSDQPLGVLALAKDTLTSLRERDFGQLTKNLVLIKSLDPRGLSAFHIACAELQFVNPAHDVEGLGELAGCTIAVMSKSCGCDAH